MFGSLGLLVIFLAVMAAFAVLAGWIQFPSSTAKLFASRIDRTVGRIQIANSGSALNNIAVHTIGSATPPEWIGLTIENGNFGQPRPITPITLSVAEARQLSELLVRAVERSEPAA